MKVKWWGYAILTVVIVGVLEAEPLPMPPSKTDEEKHAEIQRLIDEVASLHKAGKLDQAIEKVPRTITLLREYAGKNDPQVAAWQTSIAAMQEEAGDFTAARAVRTEVVTILTEVNGSEHWKTIDARQALQDNKTIAGLTVEKRKQLRLAASLDEERERVCRQGHYAEGQKLAQQALTIRRQILGERHPAIGTSLNNLGMLYFIQGQYASAESILKEALEITRQALGGGHPNTAISLNNLAEIYALWAELGKAEPLLKRALEIQRLAQGNEDPETLKCLNNLAAIYHKQGKHTQAEPLIDQALEISRRTLGERHLVTADSLANRGGLYQYQGEYSKAEPLLKQAFEIRQKLLGEFHLDTIDSLDHLATDYSYLGQYAKAEILYQKALEISTQALGKQHPKTVEILGNLAAHYARQKDYTKAEPIYKQLLEIRRSTLGECHVDTILTYHSLLLLYGCIGDSDKAESVCRQVFAALSNSPLQGDLPQCLDSNKLRALPITLMSLAKYGMCCRVPFEQQTTFKLTPGKEGTNACIGFQLNFGPKPSVEEIRSAEHVYALAGKVRERLRHDAGSEYLSKLDDKELALELIAGRISLLHRLFEAEGKTADLETALATAEEGIALAFLEQLDMAGAAKVGMGSPKLLRQEAELKAQLNALDVQINQEQSKPREKKVAVRIDRLFDQQIQLEQQLQKLITRIEQGSPQYAALKYPRPCSLAEARACLGKDEVALLYVPGLTESFVILVEKTPAQDDKTNGITIVPLPKSEEIAKEISGLCNHIVVGENSTPSIPLAKTNPSINDERTDETSKDGTAAAIDYKELAKTIADLSNPAIFGQNGNTSVPLAKTEDSPKRSPCRPVPDKSVEVAGARPAGEAAYKLLLAPLKDRIKGKDLVIVPGGPLCHLPFELLQEDGKYLIERHRIRYAPSLTALHLVQGWEKTRAKPATPLWAVANPLYNASDLRFGLLANSDEEVCAVADVLKAAPESRHTTSEASEAVVKKASADGSLARARYVHFACHGIIDFDHGQQPMLVLSHVGTDDKDDVDGGCNDGFLRLDEITRLKLNADLVVLSACQTAEGQSNKGEGGTGLARAWMFAGCRGVLSSLWLVDNAETGHFMTELYAGLQKGMRTADAVRAVKLKMIQEGKAPEAWAPFILMGE